MDITNKGPAAHASLHPQPDLGQPQKPVSSTPPAAKPSQLSRAQQIQPPSVMQPSKFRPTPVGIIYEELSLLDSFDDIPAYDFTGFIFSSVARQMTYPHCLKRRNVAPLSTRP